MPKQSFSRKNPPKWVGLVCLAAILLVAGYYGWSRWLNYELTQAKQKLEQRQWDAALGHIKTLRWLRPSSELNDFLYAAAIRHTQPATALDTLEKLVDQPESPFFEDSALMYLQLSIDLEQGEQADAMIERLSANMSDQPRYMMQRARRYTQKGEFDAAIEELRYLLDIMPNNAEAQWIRAQILLEQPRVTRWIEAKSALKAAGLSKDAWGLRSLMTLGQRPEIKLFPDERNWLIQLLERHPLADVQARLMIATQKILLEPEQKHEIASKVAETESAENPIMISRWLLGVNEPELAEKYTELAKSKLPQDEDLWRVEYQIALQNQDVERLAELLKAPNSVANEVQSKTLAAMIDLGSEQGLALEAWEEAYQLANDSKDESALLMLGRAAVTQRWWEQAETAYQSAGRNAKSQFRSANIKRELLTPMLAQKKVEEALELSKEMRQVFPANVVFQNNYYYFSALLEQGSDNQVSEFKALQEKLPVPALNATLAFLLYQEADYEQAEEALQKTPEWMNAHSDVKLLNGLVALRQGKTSQAAEFLTSINEKNLLPPESQLLKDALAELNEVNK